MQGICKIFKNFNPPRKWFQLHSDLSRNILGKMQKSQANFFPLPPPPLTPQAVDSPPTETAGCQVFHK